MINRRKDWSERQRCSVCSGITSNCVCAFCGRASLIVTGEAAPLTRLVVTQTTPRESSRGRQTSQGAMSAPGRQEWCPSTTGVRRGAWTRVWSGNGGQATRGHRENSVSDPTQRALSKGSNRVRSELET